MEERAVVSELRKAAIEILNIESSLRILTVKEWLVLKDKRIIYAAISASPEMKDLYMDLKCILNEDNADLEMMEVIKYKIKNGSLVIEYR